MLGLELGIRDDELKLYNPLTKEWVLKPVEQADARTQQAEAKVQQAEAKAQQESLARRQAEARAQQAEAELARLRTLLEQSSL